ncbi:hypothetical protein [Falsigemmobacter intermedius]|uniref:hypothetical protein n=1 Tax=Falsigemmobacter intermedius TaxID=1553448 RepID=UPI003F08461F
MTLHMPVTPPPDPRREAAEALELFDLASTILRRLLEEIRAEAPAESAKELATYTKDVSQALKLLVTERQNVEKLAREQSGGLCAGALDLGAARDEIGRRLARLRHAGDD